MMIELKTVGVYSKLGEAKKPIRRKLYIDKYGYYIKQGGCFPIVVEESEGWVVNSVVPFEIAFYRKNNHTEENIVK